MMATFMMPQSRVIFIVSQALPSARAMQSARHRIPSTRQTELSRLGTTMGLAPQGLALLLRVRRLLLQDKTATRLLDGVPNMSHHLANVTTTREHHARFRRRTS